jgi:hypothetical protein
VRKNISLFIILLIALRGFIGDAMAYEMTAGMLKTSTANTQSMDSNATKLVAPSAYSMPAIGQFSSEKVASMPCHEAADDTDVDSNSHSCSACMVCHSPLAQLFTVVTSQSQQAQAYVMLQDRAWMSAELSLFQKPPVS